MGVGNWTHTDTRLEGAHPFVCQFTLDKMGDHEEEVMDDYKVPTKVGINDIMDRDKDDVALDNYKKQLLGSAPFARACVCFLHFLASFRPSTAT